MRRKFTIAAFILFSAFMLNVSSVTFQQRYDRRDEDETADPHAIEMADSQVFKYLKNTWFFDYPLEENVSVGLKTFFVENFGFGQQYIVHASPSDTCQLKFVLINYLGFFDNPLPDNTCLQWVS